MCLKTLLSEESPGPELFLIPTSFLLKLHLIACFYRPTHRHIRLLCQTLKEFPHLFICKQDAYANKSTSILIVTAKVTKHERSEVQTLFTGLSRQRLPAFAGQTTADDRNRIAAMLYHERLYDAVSHTLLLTLTKSMIASTLLFSQITQPRYCLHHLLLCKTAAHCPCCLQNRQHQLPQVEYTQYKSSFYLH